MTDLLGIVTQDQKEDAAFRRATPAGWTHQDTRAFFDRASDALDEWQGLPVPLPDLPLRLNNRHTYQDGYRLLDQEASGHEIKIICGGPQYGDDDYEDCINRWVCRQRNAEVFVFRRGTGREARHFAMVVPLAPDRSMDRLSCWLRTLGASDAWDEKAERTARDKLRGLLTDRQWRHYDLTGSFLETSPRSRVTYMFRRLRPTIAMTGRNKFWQTDRGDENRMRVLACLCMHPIGYYDKTWAGCLTPSDDVIAHLLFMRGDEPGYWRQAYQHEPHEPEAGI